MNKIADNINGILDFAVFALRFLVVCCVRHSAPVFAFQSWDTNGFGTLQMPLVCIFQIKLRVCKSKAIHLFQKRKLFFIFGRRGNKKSSRFVQKLLCIYKHMVPNKTYAAKGFGKQNLLFRCWIRTIFYCSIQLLCRHCCHHLLLFSVLSSHIMST